MSVATQTRRRLDAAATAAAAAAAAAAGSGSQDHTGTVGVDGDSSQSNNEAADRLGVLAAAPASDGSLSPSVLDFLDRLVREQLAPELYAFVQRLRRLSAWPGTLANNATASSASGAYARLTGRAIFQHRRQTMVYLAERPAPVELSADSVSTQEPVAPLLPPHPAEGSLHFTPMLDFVKAICELFSLDKCLSRQTAVLRRDLLLLLGVGEYSSAAVFTLPHMALSSVASSLAEANVDGGRPGTAAAHSLLVFLPDVACPVCNATRDIDVCRDTHLLWQPGPASTAAINSAGRWTWVCPHCQAVYPRARIEACLETQLDQLALQHTLQDLYCAKCTVGGGVQACLMANGGAAGRCADCAGPLELTVPVTAGVLRRRLVVYAAVGDAFGFAGLRATAAWMLHRQKA